MKRFAMLCVVVMSGSSCGTLLNVGDETKDQNLNGSRACGPNTCAVGEVCCNASCGICTPPGGACTQQACLTDEDVEAAQAAQAELEAAEAAVSEPDADALDADGNLISPIVIGPQQCGKNVCAAGTHCCNASCGTCVAPGGHCTQQICTPTD